VLCTSSLQDYWSLHPIIHTPYAASVGMSQEKFLALLMMFQLNNNDAKAAAGHLGYDPQLKIQLLTHHKISGCLHTRRTPDY